MMEYLLGKFPFFIEKKQVLVKMDMYYMEIEYSI